MVAGMQGAHTGRGAGIDEVAGSQCNILRKVGDEPVGMENHVTAIGGLNYIAIYL